MSSSSNCPKIMLKRSALLMCLVLEALGTQRYILVSDLLHEHGHVVGLFARVQLLAVLYI